jgi:hypothetical protein
MSKELKNKEGLTELEIKVMEAARRTDYGDCLEESQWSFAVCDASGLSEKIYRGVVSSLIKKEFVIVHDQEGKGRSNDMVFAYTDTGKERFGEE